MASTFSSDLSLELVATGEKAGLWGSITNTNLQLLQTATSGYVEVTLSSGNVNLDLSDGSATANGKNLYIKVTGTLSGNASLTMPATTSGGNANRVFFVEDGTTRGGAGDSYTVTLLTTGQSASTQVPLPEGAPSQGDEVTIMEVAASNGFGTNKCVVARNGSNIQGGTSDLDLTSNNQCVTLIFTTATKGWQIKTNSTS